MQDGSAELERPKARKVVNRHLLAMGSEVLAPFIEALDKTRAAVAELVDSPSPHLSKRSQTLKRKLDSFEPSVTLVGQVKAGKTALTNVLVGAVDLLPSDVNPWTSVVTTLHVNSRQDMGSTKAKFTFFDSDEWTSLVANGGRLGEMANRAGASEELEKIKLQIEEMRAATRKRLGSSFEAMLGQVHKYGYYDRELIERYVCVGDVDLEREDPGNKQGRFADITRAAEIYVDLPQINGTLSLRDTPGVNDTFMVREQITIKSLRGSEVCLVVLSAHQALNTTDLALVRMISNFEHRQVILFVNRIDELAKPSEQIPEINKSIIETLKANNAPVDCEIIFGSAKWAEAALTGDLEGLEGASTDTLVDWAEAIGAIKVDDAEAHTWILSGVPALMRAVNKRILEGSGKRLLDNVRAQVRNMTNELKAEENVKGPQAAMTGPKLEAHEVRASIDKLVASSKKTLKETTDGLMADLRPRLEKAQDSFVRRATDALIAHLERFGEQDTWTYDSTGLRLLLRSAYARFAMQVTTQVRDIYTHAASEVEMLYRQSLGVNVDGFTIEAPQTPRIPPPVVLGKTIALDLNSNWWRKWWQKRRGFEAFAADYARLIQAEVGSIVQDLEHNQIAEVFDEVDKTLDSFLDEQRETLIRLSTSTSDVAATEIVARNQDRDKAEATLTGVLSVLDSIAA
ncbi:MAG: dynamin family protein [Deltaproteobacteria bacterium]